MTKKITHLALALVTLLTGCSMIPTYERPAAPVPTGFPNVTASESRATLPSWRTYFAEPRLQQLIELALNNNRDLRIASLNTVVFSHFQRYAQHIANSGFIINN